MLVRLRRSFACDRRAWADRMLLCATERSILSWSTWLRAMLFSLQQFLQAFHLPGMEIELGLFPLDDGLFFDDLLAEEGVVQFCDGFPLEEAIADFRDPRQATSDFSGQFRVVPADDRGTVQRGGRHELLDRVIDHDECGGRPLLVFRQRCGGGQDQGLRAMAASAGFMRRLDSFGSRSGRRPPRGRPVSRCRPAPHSRRPRSCAGSGA